MFLYFLIFLLSIITEYNFNHCAATLGPNNASYYNLKFVIVYVFEQIIGNVSGCHPMNQIPFLFVAYFYSLNLWFLGIIQEQL